jgi:ribosomal protein S18 acetylase RimI-like enzyme
LDAATWPEGVRLLGFTPGQAAEVHAVLTLAYSQGGGSVPPYSEWWPALATDAEFDPTLLFVARDIACRVVGVAQCWASAFIKDLAVHPEWRRRGLGRALLLHAFGVFKSRGATTVSLKVEADNPSGAMRLYQSVGMYPA